MKNIVLILLIIILLSSCNKDKFNFNKLTNTEWTPTVALPLVNSTLTVYDVLAHVNDSELVVIDPVTGLMALIYKGDLYSYKANDIVVLTDQNDIENISLTSAEILSFTTNDSITKNTNKIYTFSTLNGEKLDSIILKSGILNIKVNSNFKHNGSIKVTIPGMKKNGIPFSKTLNFNYTGTLPVAVSQSFNVDGYHLDMTLGGTTFNQFEIQYELNLNEIPGNSISTSDNISVELALNNWLFSSAFGYIGQQTLALGTDSVFIRVFNNAIDGYIQFDNPKINLYFHNSFGVPVEITFNKLQSINVPSGIITNIINNGFPNPFIINSPSLSQIGNSVLSTLTIDKNNSNIVQVMTPTPKYILNEITASSNPPSLPYSYNFLTDSSRLHLEAEVELPLIGFGWATFVDTLNFSFSDNSKEIDKIELRTIVSNGFPFNARLQVFFTDNNFNILDSIFTPTNNLIESGLVDSQGKVYKRTEKITDTPFSQDRMPNILNATNVIVWAQGETPGSSNANNVKIYDSYTITVRISLKATGKINL